MSLLIFKVFASAFVVWMQFNEGCFFEVCRSQDFGSPRHAVCVLIKNKYFKQKFRYTPQEVGVVVNVYGEASRPITVNMCSRNDFVCWRGVAFSMQKNVFAKAPHDQRGLHIG